MIDPIATPADSLLNRLRRAVDGLTYPSESDEPFTVAYWPAAVNQDACAEIQARFAHGRAVGEIRLDDFFAPLADSSDAARFASLRQTLERELRSVRVFRVGLGQARIDVILIGQAPGVGWAALCTESVET